MKCSLSTIDGTGLYFCLPFVQRNVGVWIWLPPSAIVAFDGRRWLIAGWGWSHRDARRRLILFFSRQCCCSCFRLVLWFVGLIRLRFGWFFSLLIARQGLRFSCVSNRCNSVFFFLLVRWICWWGRRPPPLISIFWPVPEINTNTLTFQWQRFFWLLWEGQAPKECVESSSFFNEKDVIGQGAIH